MRSEGAADVNSPITETLTALREKGNSFNPLRPKGCLNPPNRKFPSTRKMDFCSLGCLLIAQRGLQEFHDQAGVLAVFS